MFRLIDRNFLVEEAIFEGIGGGDYDDISWLDSDGDETEEYHPPDLFLSDDTTVVVDSSEGYDTDDDDTVVSEWEDPNSGWELSHGFLVHTRIIDNPWPDPLPVQAWEVFEEEEEVELVPPRPPRGDGRGPLADITNLTM